MSSIPAYRYLGYPEIIQSAFGLNKLFVQKSDKGFIYNESEYDGSQLEVIDSIDYCQDVKAIELFDKFLSEEVASGVKVVFVYAPIFKDATEKMNNLFGMYEMYDSLARKFEIPVIDYTFAPISSDSAYFYNAMHLNKRGADLFSKELAREVNAIICKK